MIEKLIICTLLTASLSWLVTQSEIFSPFRMWIIKRTRFFGKLCDCHYCLSHWIAFAIVIMFDIRLIGTYFILDWLLTAVTMAWLVTFLNAILDRIWE